MTTPEYTQFQNQIQNYKPEINSNGFDDFAQHVITIKSTSRMTLEAISEILTMDYDLEFTPDNISKDGAILVLQFQVLENF